MNLAAMQASFMAQVLDEEAPAPSAWSDRHVQGMAVYRNNYRSALVEALRSTYERTARWVGEETFERAAAHHLITHPPSSWTIDDAGAGFASTCEELFRNDPEVAELAWLEWSMLEAFAQRDAAPLSPADFAEVTAHFGEEDWAGSKINFLPGSVARSASVDLKSLWTLLAVEEFERTPPTIGDFGIIVWREGERPTFAMVNRDEAAAFRMMDDGASYAQVCEMLAANADSPEAFEAAAMQAGAMLGRWLGEGMIERISPG